MLAFIGTTRTPDVSILYLMLANCDGDCAVDAGFHPDMHGAVTTDSVDARDFDGGRTRRRNAGKRACVLDDVREVVSALFGVESGQLEEELFDGGSLNEMNSHV